MARPPSTSYQLKKFARRHRALVAGAASVVLVLAFGMVVSTWEAVRARRAEVAAVEQRDMASTVSRVATAERDRAVEAEKSAQKESERWEAASAKAVNDFLQNDLLAQASAANQSKPTTKPDPDLKVRTALDRAADRITGNSIASRR